MLCENKKIVNKTQVFFVKLCSTLISFSKKWRRNGRFRNLNIRIYRYITGEMWFGVELATFWLRSDNSIVLTSFLAIKVKLIFNRYNYNEIMFDNPVLKNSYENNAK
jgi:hypothetical protein